MRLPVVVASPWSAGDPNDPSVSSLVFDHTSVLKLIEWRWGLPPLTPRDASNDVNNLVHALNFNRVQTAVPSLPKPPTPFFVWPCFGGIFGAASSQEAGGQESAAPPAERKPIPSAQKTAVWGELQSLAKQNGFPVE